jgi:hypothetical protein
MRVPLTVILILKIFGINAAIWAIVIPLIKRSYARASKHLQADLSVSGENVLISPVNAYYHGRTDKFDITGGSAVALTDKRLVIRKLTSEVIEIPTSDIVSVRTAKWFNGKYRNGRYHVIVKTTENIEFGFQTPNYTAWVNALEHLIKPSPNAVGKTEGADGV